MLFSLCACGGGNGATEPQAEGSTPEATEQADKDCYPIGEEVSSEYFPFTVTSVNFADRVSSKIGDDFLKPDVSGSLVGTVSAEKGYKWLCYDIEYTYCGKTTLSLVESLFTPTVYFEDYEFGSDYFTFAKIDNKWFILNNDFTGVGHPLLKELSSNGYSKYEPMDDTVYEIRGVIKVPDKIIGNSETPIILKLYNVERASSSEITMEGYNFQIDEGYLPENTSDFEEEAREQILNQYNDKYVSNNIDKFTRLSGEEIGEVIIGEWNTSRGYAFTFDEDGRQLSGSQEYTWEVKGDCLDIGGYEWAVYMLFDNVYFLEYNTKDGGVILTK